MIQTATNLASLLWPLVLLLIVLYGVFRLITYIRGMHNEAFEGVVARHPYDIGTFLAARAIYDDFWQRDGERICGGPGATDEPLCTRYGTVLGSGGSGSGSGPARYSPPVLGGSSSPTELTAASFAPLTVDDVTLENTVFTYYRAEPATKTFRTADEYTLKTDLERFIDDQAGVTRSESTAADGSTVAEYTCYIRIGGLNYRVVKDITGTAQELLSCSKVDPISRRPTILYAAAGTRAPSTYKQSPVSDERLFEAMIAADSQNTLDGLLSAAAIAAGAAAGSASASAGAAQAGPANLNLPPLRFVEDAWIKNSELFKQMYDSLKDRTETIKNYYKSANISNMSNTYVTTLNKFVELDKRILRAAGAGLPPKTKSGTAYRFLIPNAYDPALQILGDNYEEPAQPAKYMKCYDLSQQEQALVNYFKRGRGGIENPGQSAEVLASKVQAAICSSYGYYTSTTAEGACNCNGCCIPVNYKPRDGRMAGPSRTANRAAAAADETSAEILSKVDNCLHISQPFQIRRTGPVIKMAPTCTGAGLETEEGFMELPTNYGLTRGQAGLRDAFTEAKGAVIGARDQWRGVL